MVNLGTAIAFLELDTSRYTTALQTAGQQMKGFGDDSTGITSKLGHITSSLDTVGTAMTVGITAPLVGLGAMAIKEFASLETSLNKLGTIADTNIVPMDELKKQVMDLSNEMGIASGEIAEASYQAISAGVETEKAVGFVAEANKLAIAGFTDSATAVDVLTTALNAYGLETEESTRVSDILLQTQNKGKTTVDELAGSLGSVIPVASSTNTNIEALGASMAILTANGIATSESATYLKSMLSELSKTGSTVDQALREVAGKSFAQLQEEGVSLGDILAMLSEHAENSGLTLKDLFGSVEAGSAALVLAKGDGQEFNKMLEEMYGSAGATEEAFETMDQGIERSLEKLRVSAENLAITFGEELAPAVAFLADALQKGVDALNDMSDGQRKFVVVLASVLAIIGPLALAISGVIKAFGIVAGVVKSVIGAFGAIKGVIVGVQSTLGAFGVGIGAISAPVIAVVAAVAGLIAIGVALYKNWDEIKAKAGEIGTAISETWAGMKESVSQGWDNIKQSTSEKWAEISGVIEANGGGIAGFLETSSQGFKGVWQKGLDALKEATGISLVGVKDSFTNGLGDLGGVISGSMDKAKGVFSGVLEGWADVAEGAWDVIKNIFMGAVLLIIDLVTLDFEGFKEDLANIMDNIREGFSKAFDGITKVVTEWREIGGKAVDAVKTMLSEKWDEIKERSMAFAGELATSIKDGFWDTVENAKTGVADLRKNVVEGIDNLIEWFRGLPSRLKERAIDAIEGFKAGVVEKRKEVSGNIKDMAEDVIDKVKSLPGDLLELGKDMMRSLAKGIKDGVLAPVRAARDMAGNIADAIRKKLEFGSPSKVMIEFGGWIGEGLQVGMKDMFSSLRSTANQMGDVVMDSMANIKLGEVVGTTLRTSQGQVSKETVYVESRNQESSDSKPAEIHLHIGTLIADNQGLKELERRLREIRLSETARRGGAFA